MIIIICKTNHSQSDYSPTVSGNCFDIIWIASLRWILSNAFATSLNVFSGKLMATHCILIICRKKMTRAVPQFYRRWDILRSSIFSPLFTWGLTQAWTDTSWHDAESPSMLKSLGRTNPLNTIFGWAPKTSNFEEQTKKVRARFQNNLKVLSSYDACYRLNFLKLHEAWRARTQFAHMHDSNLLGKSQLGSDLVHIIADSDIKTTPIFS